MRRFKLTKSLTISDLAVGQTVSTETMPYVYLNANGIYFSQCRTKNPIKAFNDSISQLFFLDLDNAAMAFDTIHSAACAGYDRIDIDEHSLRDISFRFVQE